MDEKILDKLQKIIRILDGAKTEGEAAAALNRASAILDGSGLSLEEFRERFGADAEENPEDVQITIERGSLYIRAARASIQHCMAVYVVCAVCGLENGPYVKTLMEGAPCLRFLVFGRQDALAAAGRLLQSVIKSSRGAWKLWKETSPTYGYCVYSRRKLSTDFMLGFWSGLIDRTKPRTETKVIENQSTALVRAADIIRARTSALAKAKKTDFDNEYKSRMRRSRFSTGISSDSAYEDGVAASKNVNLHVDKQKQLAC
jgi:hypothetical protein